MERGAIGDIKAEIASIRIYGKLNVFRNLKF